MIAFSWPSDGVTFGTAGGAQGEEAQKWAYSSDREDAKASGLAIARFALRMTHYLRELSLEERCPQRVHLVAHSMGNWALRHTVQGLVELLREESERPPRLFDNAFLMAADLDDAALEREDWLKPLFRLAASIHVYHANNDSALSASDLKPNQGPRLGHKGPANMAALPDRVHAIDCENVSWTPADGFQRHQYYRVAPEMVRDVCAVLAGVPPEDFQARVAAGPGRWRIRLDRPARDLLEQG